MPKIQYVGRALPLQLGITVVPSDISWQDDDTGLSATFKVRIAQSIINVDVDTNRYTVSDTTPLLTRAFDLARISVNLVAFAVGAGTLVVFDFVIEPNGVPKWLVPMDPA
jgi:hypothetical protein